MTLACSPAVPVTSEPVTPSTPPSRRAYASSSSPAVSAGPGRVTATVMILLGSAPNRSASAVVTTRASASAGSTQSPGRAQFAVRNGAPSPSSSATMRRVTAAGRRMTACATRYQRSCVPRFLSRGQGMRHLSTRRPTRESRAGSRVTELSTANATTATPAYPMELRKRAGKRMRPVKQMASASPEKATVRPAVAVVRRTASSTSDPAASSSRNRLTMNRA